jgi:hypothetical protein
MTLFEIFHQPLNRHSGAKPEPMGRSICGGTAAMREEKWPAVYILASRKRGTLYVGVTSQLWTRLAEHKDGALKALPRPTT